MIVGMLAMMEICVRFRNHNTPYIISTRPPSSRTRRSLIGKISSDTNNSYGIPYRNGLNNESTPIYLVNSSSTESTPSSPSSSNTSALSAPQAPRGEFAEKPYHQQEYSEIESERSTHVEPSTQYSSNSNNCSFLESPILSNIHGSTSQVTQAQENGDTYQVADHYYSRGYISNQRKRRSGLVICEHLIQLVIDMRL